MTDESTVRIGFRSSREPKHSPSLGPEPTTVAEWVKMTEETGILEFPLLLEIAAKLEIRLADTDSFLKRKSKECEDAWKHQRYWEEEATKARRAADEWRSVAAGRKAVPE